MNNNYQDKLCHNCGSKLLFNENKYICEYCDSVFNEDELNKKNHILNINNDFNINEFNSPTKFIPFSKTKEDFLNVIKDNTFAKLFIPKVFKRNKLDDIKMVYAPFYLFDIKGDGDTIFKCSDINAKVNDGCKYIYVRNYKTTVNSKCDFIKLPVCGCSEFNEDILNGINPFNNDKLIDFNITSNDINFMNIDVDINKSLDIVSSKIKHIVNDLVMKKTEHKISIIEDNNTSFDLINCKLVYYPIYYIEKEYDNKIYYYSMNGESGKYDLDIPLSKFKMIVYTITFMILVFIIIFILLINL